MACSKVQLLCTGDRQRKRNKLKSGLSSSKARRSIERHIRFIDAETAKLEQEIEQLKTYYRPHNTRLQAVLGRRLAW